MQWIAQSERDAASASLEKRLWDTADQFRANSGLKAQEYSSPILGLIFLRFAEVRFASQRAKLDKAGASSPRDSRVDDPIAYHADNVLYLAPESRYGFLLNLPEAADIGSKVNEAMRAVETHNKPLDGVLPKTFNLFTSTLLKELLRKISEIPATLDFDAFGRIYEYFLGEFAMSEGQGGGEFYTPASIVKLLAQVIEPYRGRILDPACGSGGIFRAVGPLCGRAPQEPRCRFGHLRRGEDRGDRPPRPPESRRARIGRRHPPRRQCQQLLRRPARGHRQVRLRDGQSALQRQRGGQGAAEGHGGCRPALTLWPAAHRQRQLPLDPALLFVAQRQGPRRLC